MLEKLSSVEDKITGEYQFAFRKTYQAAEVCFVMRQMTEKAREFGKHFWMMDADIWKAYDTVEHDEFAAAADEVGVHRACTAAVIREMRRACSVVQLPGIGRSRPVRRLRSFFPGRPGGAATLQSNATAESCGAFRAALRRAGMGDRDRSYGFGRVGRSDRTAKKEDTHLG